EGKAHKGKGDEANEEPGSHGRGPPGGCRDGTFWHCTRGTRGRQINRRDGCANGRGEELRPSSGRWAAAPRSTLRCVTDFAFRLTKCQLGPQPAGSNDRHVYWLNVVTLLGKQVPGSFLPADRIFPVFFVRREPFCRGLGSGRLGLPDHLRRSEQGRFRSTSFLSFLVCPLILLPEGFNPRFSQAGE